MFYLGIDPGESGAVAIIDSDGNPVYTSTFTSFKEFKIFLHLNHYTAENLFSVIEKVHGFPGMNVKAMTTFMINFGGWLATYDILAFPYQLFAPKTWQNKILGSFPKGKSKPTALAFAKRRWPALNLTKDDHGVIDALCIALYGRHIHLGSKNEN